MNLKLIAFIGIFSMFVTAVIHFISLLVGKSFPLDWYWIMPIAMIATVMFMYYILEPLVDRWLD